MGVFLHILRRFRRLRRLQSTVTLHNHSSGAFMAPTLGYFSNPPTPLPSPGIHQPRVLYAHKEESGREFQITHPGVFRPSRVLHAFSGCSINVYSPNWPNSSAWCRVITKLPVRENFLLEAVVTMCCKVSSHVH
jgi:hypothetical protein